MFSKKSLAVFFLFGPLIGALGAGETFKYGMPFMLIPIYVVGGYFAATTWVMYSVIFRALHELSFKYSVIDKIFFESFAIFWSAFFAAICGYASFSLFTCASSFRILAGAASCAIHIFQHAWGVTILPGAICGAIGTPFLEDGRFIRR